MFCPWFLFEQKFSCHSILPKSMRMHGMMLKYGSVSRCVRLPVSHVLT